MLRWRDSTSDEGVGVGVIFLLIFAYCTFDLNLLLDWKLRILLCSKQDIRGRVKIIFSLNCGNRYLMFKTSRDMCVCKLVNKTLIFHSSDFRIDRTNFQWCHAIFYGWKD